MSIPWTTEEVFDSYNIVERTYKTVLSHDIKTAILVPKNIKPGPHLILYHIHGGFLATAHGLFAPFFPKWVDRLALEHSAVIISPDYRLLPSRNGVEDVLEDVEDGWKWIQSNLVSLLEDIAPGVEPDFQRVLLAGGSAGGYCVTQLAFSHPEVFRAVATAYPLLDPKDKIFREGPGPDEPTVLGFAREDMPSKEDTLSWVEEKRKDIHTKDGFERTRFAVAACHHGIFTSHIFDNKHLDRVEFSPLERLRIGQSLPQKMWILQGDADTTTHIRGADKFVAQLQKSLPDVTLRYDVVAGQDHGFEFDETTWESFAPEALHFISEAWVGAGLA